MSQPSKDLVTTSIGETEAGIYKTPAWEKAVLLSRCDFIPTHCKGKPWNVMFILEVAKDLGIQETFALQNLFITPDGKLGMEASVVRAILLSKGYQIHYHESTAEKAIVEVVRPGGKQGETSGAFKATWDIPRANKISFKNKKGEQRTLSQKFNWKMYPTQMLRHRALMEAAREVAADDLGGVAYSKDEVEDSFDNTEDTLAAAELAAGDQEKIDPELIPVEVQQTVFDAAHRAGSSIEHAQAAMLDIQKWVRNPGPGVSSDEVIQGCKRELTKLQVEYAQQKDVRQKAKEEYKRKPPPTPAAPPPPEEADERPPPPEFPAASTPPSSQPAADLADDAPAEDSPWGDELSAKERAEILK